MLKVLIVDDSVTLVQRLRSSLAGIPRLEIVGEAADVPEAILEIQRTKPDVVILDMGMPGGSGLDVLGNLKMERCPPTVIMLSNYNSRQHRERSLQSGARYYFDKSTEFHKVAEVLRNMADVVVA